MQSNCFSYIKLVVSSFFACLGTTEKRFESPEDKKT